MGVLVFTIVVLYLLNLKFNILKYLIERKIHFIFYSLLAAFFISLFVQFYENIYRLDNYWINKNGYLSEIIEDKEIISKDEKAFQKYLKDFKPSPEENEKWNCYKNFVSKDVDFEKFDIVINSIRILQFSSVDNTCYKNTSKVFMNISYILVIVGLSFTIFFLLYKKLNLIIRKKNHSVVIGLNNNSRELISKLIAKKENIRIYENDSTNKYINELENIGEIITTGKLEYTIESNNCEIINAKEIFIINDSDAESLNNLALILSKFKHENRRLKDKTKIYIEIKNRENKSFFDKKGIYDLVGDNYEIVIFSINELIAQRMFKKRPLVSNLDKNNLNYNENVEILIVGFNDLSEEILYNILKLAHFDLRKYVDIKIIDDEFENLNIKYRRIIDKGLDTLKDGSEIFWKLKFLPYSKLYEDETFINKDKFKFNRVILCDKKLNNSMDILNYINNNYSTQLIDKNTIVQLFNEHININESIDNDKENTYKNFFTFGDIETIVTYENITNNRLYQVSKATNDYKEIDKGKKWENTDSFTRESNFTEKLHMNIKLNILSLKINWENENLIINTPSSNFPTLYDFYDYFFVPNEPLKIEKVNKFKVINTLMNKYIDNSNGYFKELIENEKGIEEFIKLNKVFENFTKRFDDSKFELFDFENLKKEKLIDIYNKLNSVENNFENFSQKYLDKYKPIKIEELFKIINWENKPTHVKRKKLTLFLNNFNMINQKKYYEDLTKCFEDFDKNYDEDIIDINSNDFKIIKESHQKEIEKLNLKTRQDFSKFYEKISCINKDLKKAFEKLGEYGEFEIKLNDKQKSVIDEVYKKLSDIQVPKDFIKLEEKKVKLNICMLLSSIEMYCKIKSNKNENIEKHIDQLAELEHKRWNAYHILNGWKRRRIKEKDQIKKEHFNLCDWETLKEDDIGVVKYDYKNIYQIPFVAYCLGGEIVKIEDQ